jgi:hypothetical protein
VSYNVGMSGFMIRTGVRMLGLAGILYFIYFVKFGSHTLHGHFSRIAGTQEATELSREVSTKAAQAYAAVKSRVTGSAQ